MYFMGTRKQKSNFMGNRGTRDNLGKQGAQEKNIHLWRKGESSSLY